MARANSLNATIAGFMKMFTLVLRPDTRFNLPVFSVDFIFIGSKRVFIIEIIDPAHIEDANKGRAYEKMRSTVSKVERFEPSGTGSDWSREFLEDFSIHIKADRQDDELLFEVYQTYLTAYLDMASHAADAGQPTQAKQEQGLRRYVETLLEKGGPAVDVFEKLLGKEKQAEYVRSVIFGVD